jgi:3-hydroxybutyryl-CoA dehydrogenase
MDLVGLDVGLAVSRSFYEQSFGEPRWRPSVLAARMVAGGRLGRKSGRGWYAYPPGRPPDPSPPARGGGSGLVVIAGDTALAEELREAAASAGWDAVEPAEAEGEVPALIVDCGETEDDTPLQGAHQVVLCDQAPLAELDPGGGSAGFSLLPPLGRLAELTVQETTAPGAVAAAERFFGTLGMVVERVGDAPGLVLARIVVGLVNEACFAVGEGVGSEADVDAGMVLGLNHPRGPFEWGATVGFDVVAGLLAGLWEEYRSECYRPAPELLRRVRTSTPH